MRTAKLSELAALVGGTLEGGTDVSITGVKGIEQAGAGDITFIANPKYAKYAPLTRAAALILPPGIAVDKPCIRTPEPYFAFMTVLKHFTGETPASAGIHPTAVIGEGSTVGAGPSVQAHVTIGRNVVIGDHAMLCPGVVIGDNCRIGNNALFYANVVLREGTQVGNNVIIQPGAVIGSDGFGYVKQGGAYQKIPQVGTVIIEDDVEIGANTTIDRATLNATIIRRGTKIDNLVQIAHNVEVGEHTAVAAQAGVSGSTKIGKRVIIAGQAGFVGHIQIGDDAVICAQAGISKEVEPGAKVTGTPAREFMAMRRIDAAANHLPEALKEIKRLREELEELKTKKVKSE